MLMVFGCGVLFPGSRWEEETSGASLQARPQRDTHASRVWCVRPLIGTAVPASHQLFHVHPVSD